ncbi:MAG: hypothetical protein H7Z14_11695 [Anaerolineae bacterium]|nr:hypothetical protein [Phycisphaerae bacterium]
MSVAARVGAHISFRARAVGARVFFAATAAVVLAAAFAVQTGLQLRTGIAGIEKHQSALLFLLAWIGESTLADLMYDSGIGRANDRAEFCAGPIISSGDYMIT